MARSRDSDTLRERLKVERVRAIGSGSPPATYLPIHGDAEAALEEADEAMYVGKGRKPGGRRRAG